MVNHNSLTAGDFWAPPGGGINFGERAKVCLQREFLEETGLTVEIGDFLFAAEFINPPLHAVELFFKVAFVSGDLIRGSDPEMKPEQQIIQDAKFLSCLKLRK